jgi:hypothetical protein
MAANATPSESGRRRRGMVFATVVVLGAIGAIVATALFDNRSEWKRVDYRGLRIEVPRGFVVQDVDGKVDGELACPDADGFVFAGEFKNLMCNPPGPQTIVRLFTVGHSVAYDWPGSPRARRAGDLTYRLVDRTHAHFVEPDVHVRVDGARAREILDAIVARARRSPARGLATPTTATARTAVTDRLAERLGCEQRLRASTAAWGGFRGRQREAPIDCQVDRLGYRIIVPRGAEAKRRTVAYYTAVWLVVGPDWVITAANEHAARRAHQRVGGSLRAPPGWCCGPPPSDYLPGFDSGR